MSNVKVHKLEVMIIDFDGLGADGVKQELENANFPNDCIHPRVKALESREVDWSDDHPLNKLTTCEEEYRRLFSIPQEIIPEPVPIVQPSIRAMAEQIKAAEAGINGIKAATVRNFCDLLAPEVVSLEEIPAVSVKPAKDGFIISRCGRTILITVITDQPTVAVYVVKAVPNGAGRTGDIYPQRSGRTVEAFRNDMARVVADYLLS